MTRAEEIREIVAVRGIRQLVHFTPVSNIPLIVENGIVPLKDLRDHGIEPTTTDKLRLDGLLHASCLSVSFPQPHMLAKALRRYKAEPHVVIGIDPRVLWEKDCAFSPTNAASGKLDGVSVDDLRAPEVLEVLFTDLQWQTRDPVLPAQYPTDVQAEVLVFDWIEPKYFLGAVVNRNPKRTYWPFLDRIGWSIQDGQGSLFDEDRMRAIEINTQAASEHGPAHCNEP